MMPTVKENRTNYYTGETCNQLRDGFGIYYYGNKFFRYEGDWLKGKKHGHGKLIMGDGSYYEGEFKNGEIEGHGFRKWQHTGHSYSGEFHFGEMHGHGVLNYADGSQYKGQFQYNYRHGSGVYRDKVGNTYEGTWHNNRQNGHGTLTFRNGDIFEGEFVGGSRQGHGVLRFADGGRYKGQWYANNFDGEGEMMDCSGVTYSGIWLNGSPELSAKELQLVGNAKSVECTQGQSFDVRLQLVDQHGNVLEDESGRKFEISAGIKYVPQNKTHQSFLELIEDIEEKPLPTPFGYDVLPYTLLEAVDDSVRLSVDNITTQENFELRTQDDKTNGDDVSTLKSKASLTESNLSFDESKSWLLSPPPSSKVSEGFLNFDGLFLPYLEPKVPEDTKSKKSRESRTASAVSTSSSEEKTVAGTSKQKASMEKGAVPGEYVLIIKDVTEPSFLGKRLENFFTVVTVSAPKQPKKSKSKV